MLGVINDKLQKFLKTDTGYLMSGGRWLLAVRFGSLAVAFALSLLYARLLPKELYGNYRYVLNILGIFSFLSLPGLGTAMVYAVARGFEGSFIKATKVQFFSSLLFIAVGVGGFFWFQNQHQSELAWAFLAGSVFMILVEPSTNYLGYYNAKKEFKTRALASISAKFVYGVIMLAAVLSIYFFQLSLLVSLMLLVVGYLGASTLPHLFFLREAMKKIPDEASSEKNLLKDGFKFTLIDMPSHILTYLDSVLIYHLLGPVNLAIYSFAEAIPDQFRGTMKSIGTALAAPKLAGKDIVSLKESDFISKALRFSLLLIPLIALYILAAPFIYRWFYPAYTDSIFISQLLAVSLLAIPNPILNEGLRATRQMKYVTANSFISSIAQIIFFLILIPLFGLVGAALARIAGRILSYILSASLLIMAAHKSKPNLNGM